jgi:D-inositol-3-phosphate glycosyltransferase
MADREPRNVAFIHPYAVLYGAEQSLLALLRQLDRSKYTPHLVLLSIDGPLAEAARSTGAVVHILPWLQQAKRARWRERLRSALRLRKWLREHRIRIVHVNIWVNDDPGTYWLAAKLAGARCVIGVRTQLERDLDPRDQIWLARTDRIVSVSRKAVAPLLAPQRLDRLGRVKSERVLVIPPSRDLEALRRTEPASAAALAAIGLRGGQIVGAVAAINAIKRPDVFLRAAALLAATRPELQFVMIGGAYDPEHAKSAEYVAGVKRLAEDLGIAHRVVFAGFRSDAVALMRHFSVLVVSSMKEGHSGVMIEAMALGVPVVASAVGGIPDTITDPDTGSLIHSFEPGDYAAAVTRYLDNPELVRRVTDAAREAVARFDVRHAARQLEACYDQLLDRRSRGADATHAAT